MEANEDVASVEAEPSIQCASCNRQLLPEAMFCGYCGQSVPSGTGGLARLLCPTCWKSVLAGSSFCGYCGTALATSAPVSETLPSLLSSERLDETIEAMDEQTAARAALWIVGGVVGFILLVIFLAICERGTGANEIGRNFSLVDFGQLAEDSGSQGSFQLLVASLQPDWLRLFTGSSLGLAATTCITER